MASFSSTPHGRDFQSQIPSTSGKRHSHGCGSKICAHCERPGHTIDTCYRKHGFSPQMQNSQFAHHVHTPDEIDEGDDGATVLSQAYGIDEYFKNFHTVLPDVIWGSYEYPSERGDGWVGDPRTWELDVGGFPVDSTSIRPLGRKDIDCHHNATDPLVALQKVKRIIK
ncbi:unnamed protein product [Sphenostylis stenocarpa]|uniref:DUF7705 domain-containing protein n=1 Tax=Sphenostylis stenocarpa TaxID=92480 RepID=A0AA86S3D7_9FABA|nr:unnamed protein product [Sphenostylis stenocarpa]